MKKISIVTSCFNEVDLIENYEKEVVNELLKFTDYDWEIIISDNCSNDGTIEKLKEICKKNKKIKLLINSKNYGAERSGFNALKYATGDVIITLNADLEEPPSSIKDFVSLWEKGCGYAVGKKTKSNENIVIKNIKKLFYLIFNWLSETKIVSNSALLMLDKKNLDKIKNIHDPDPFLRGIIAETLGSPKFIELQKTTRKKGSSKHGFFDLYSVGATGIFKMSKAPMRIITFLGFVLSFIFFIIFLYYLLYKLFFWSEFNLGIAPLIVFLCLLASFVLLAIGIIGEYILNILYFSKNMPIIVEEKINFDN